MKPVRRIYELGERRPIVVVFNPDGVVDFREKGKRTRYSAHLRSLFTIAIRNYVEDEKKKKKLDRLARRAARSNS